ncbi:MAG: phosphoribosyl-AMP cyclohydrolase, partial [Bacteroidota bacterium]
MKKLLMSAAILGVLAAPAYADAHDHKEMEKTAITEEAVIEAQNKWGAGIVAIGQVYSEEGDYKARATQHINDLYAYDHGTVLFKPTLAADDQFRENFDQALSYFVTGYIEDYKGFAIKPWTAVRFENHGIVTDSDSATAMGNYFFTPKG